MAGEWVSENFAFHKYKYRNCATNIMEVTKDLIWNFNYISSLVYNIKPFLHKFMNKILEKRCECMILLSIRISLICYFRCLHSPTLRDRDN